MKTPTSIEELIQHLQNGDTATFRGFPITLVEPEEGTNRGRPIPTYWMGRSGFHIKQPDLETVIIDVPGCELEDDEKPTFYEGLYIVRVLSDRPQGDVSGPTSLAGILNECHSGDFVGELVHGQVNEVSAIHMAELLTQAGSEPGFFQLPDAQELASELHDSASTEGCTPDLVVVERRAYNRLMRTVGLGAYALETDEPDDEET